MKLYDSNMRRFLEIQSHERFANIYFKFSTTPLVVLSKKRSTCITPSLSIIDTLTNLGD